jgi:hypothetical protein
MVARQPIGGFKVVRYVTEKISVLIHYRKWHNISSQYQYLSNRLQYVLLDERLVGRKF